MSSLDEELERYKQAHGGRFSQNGTKDTKTTLYSDEKIIWEGVGEYSKELNRGNNSGAPKLFAVYWLGFSIFWTFLATVGGGIFGLFGVPFIIIGVCLLKSNKQKPKFVLTNKRIITKIGGRDYYTRLESIANASVNVRADGKGDILYFAENSLNENLTASGGIMNGIENADYVYTLFENAVYDSQKN